MIETAENTEDMRNDAADLYRLAFLLTGRQDLSIDIAADTAVSSWDDASPFGNWMRGWQRRLVIGRALTEVHDELADSARRTERARAHGWTVRKNWSLGSDTTKADLDQALLAIDLFPRAVLLLVVFESIRTADAATLLDADPALIRKAQAIGLRELTANLAGKKSSAAPKTLCSWLRTMAICH
jgi:DNA-directed RNA polymerase specialized sigma24 family protein